MLFLFEFCNILILNKLQYLDNLKSETENIISIKSQIT